MDEGRTLHLWGNNWKATNCVISLAEDARKVIDFKFKSVGEEAEINGVGLDTETGGLNEEWFYKCFGTQDWGAYTQPMYSGSGEYEKLSAYLVNFTGNFNYLILSNDADAGQQTDVYYSDIRIRKYVDPEPTHVETGEGEFLGYTLLITSTPVENVNIEVNGVSTQTPYTNIFDEGAQVEVEVKITYYNYKKYIFQKWDDENIDNPRTFTITDDITRQIIVEERNTTPYETTINGVPVKIYSVPSGKIFKIIVYSDRIDVIFTEPDFIKWDDGDVCPAKYDIELNGEIELTGYFGTVEEKSIFDPDYFDKYVFVVLPAVAGKPPIARPITVGRIPRTEQIAVIAPVSTVIMETTRRVTSPLKVRGGEAYVADLRASIKTQPQFVVKYIGAPIKAKMPIQETLVVASMKYGIEESVRLYISDPFTALKKLTMQRDYFKKQTKRYRIMVSETQMQLQLARSEFEQKEKEAIELARKLIELHGEVEKNKKKIETSKRWVRKYSEQLAKLTDEINGLKEKINVLETEKQNLLEKSESLRNQVNGLQLMIDELERERNKLKRKLKKFAKLV